jgi:lipid-binding SYLF domain-containing protein
MNRSTKTALALALAAVAAAPATAFPPPPPQTLQAATDVLNDLTVIPGNRIPAALLAQAQGVAIFPHVLKAGFLIGGRGGHGVVLTRDRNGAWSGVTFVDLGGASFGLQAGVESADVVLVFKTRDSLNRVIGGRGKLTLGADATIAVGPVGRDAEAGTDLRLRAEIVSYSRSRGLFAGVALDGAAIIYNPRTNSEYLYDRRPETVQLTVGLLTRLAQLSAPPPPPAVILQSPVIIPAAGALPPPPALVPPGRP